MKLRKTLALVAAVAMAFVAMVVPASAGSINQVGPYEVVIGLADLPAGRTFADVYGVKLQLDDAGQAVAQAGFGGGFSYFWDGYDKAVEEGGSGLDWDAVTIKWCAYDCLTVGENPDHEGLLYNEEQNAIIRFEEPIFPETIEALTVKVEMWWGGDFNITEYVLLGEDGEELTAVEAPEEDPEEDPEQTPDEDEEEVPGNTDGEGEGEGEEEPGESTVPGASSGDVDGNPDTGVALVVVPAVLATAALATSGIVLKKRSK